jgi:hypothetical protein
MSLVHGWWTTETPDHHGPASIAGQRSSLELSLRPFWGSRLTTKGRGGGSGVRETRWAAHWRLGGSEAVRRWRKVVVLTGVGACSDARDEARRTVWGEAR